MLGIQDCIKIIKYEISLPKVQKNIKPIESVKLKKKNRSKLII